MALYTPPRDLEGQPLTTADDKPHETYELEKPGNAITRKQLFYILVPQGVGAAIINAAVNFALACAMYRTTRKEIRLWSLNKNTIAGDMGVTVIIQGILTMLITSALVRGDIRTGRVEPFSCAWPHPTRWLRMAGARCYLGRALRFLSPTQTLSLRAGRREFCKSLFIILVRGFIISAFYFFLLWPLAIAITAPLYGGVDMHGTWTPQVIKAVFGGVLGLTMNPLVAALVLGVSAPAPQPPRAACKSKIASTTQIIPVPVAQPEMRQAVKVPQVSVPVPAHVSPRT